MSTAVRDMRGDFLPERRQDVFFKLVAFYKLAAVRIDTGVDPGLIDGKLKMEVREGVSDEAWHARPVGLEGRALGSRFFGKGCARGDLGPFVCRELPHGGKETRLRSLLNEDFT